MDKFFDIQKLNTSINVTAYRPYGMGISIAVEVCKGAD